MENPYFYSLIKREENPKNSGIKSKIECQPPHTWWNTEEGGRDPEQLQQPSPQPKRTADSL